MTYDTLAWLFTAGLISGIMNSLAGGGSLVSFPALLAAGVPAVSASATNSFSVTPGYIAGAFALRKYWQTEAKFILCVIPVAVVGGWIGAGLLLSLTNQAFEAVVPWLLVLALTLIVIGPQVSRVVSRWSPRNQSGGGSQLGEPSSGGSLWSTHRWKLLLGLPIILLISSYGGFFNAGMGLMVLACLSLIGMPSAHTMNGIKLIVSSATSITAVARFLYEGSVSFPEGLTVLAGTIVGGYGAAYLSRYISDKVLRLIVLAIGSTIVVVFFLR